MYQFRLKWEKRKENVSKNIRFTEKFNQPLKWLSQQRKKKAIIWLWRSHREQTEKRNINVSKFLNINAHVLFNHIRIRECVNLILPYKDHFARPTTTSSTYRSLKLYPRCRHSLQKNASSPKTNEKKKKKNNEQNQMHISHSFQIYLYRHFEPIISDFVSFFIFFIFGSMMWCAFIYFFLLHSFFSSLWIFCVRIIFLLLFFSLFLFQFLHLHFWNENGYCIAPVTAATITTQVTHLSWSSFVFYLSFSFDLHQFQIASSSLSIYLI